jgi:hypothetical protein
LQKSVALTSTARSGVEAPYASNSKANTPINLAEKCQGNAGGEEG